MKLPVKIEIIFWQDAYISQDENPDLENDTQLTITVGHQTKEDNDKIYISHFYDGIGGQWSSPYTIIPKGMVKKRYEIIIKKPRRQKNAPLVVG